MNSVSLLTESNIMQHLPTNFNKRCNKPLLTTGRMENHSNTPPIIPAIEVPCKFEWIIQAGFLQQNKPTRTSSLTNPWFFDRSKLNQPNKMWAKGSG